MNIPFAGFCLLRLGRLRPSVLPARVGISTENASHRVAVEWDGPDGVQRGVWITRRDSDSRLTVLLGGRAFPGVHHRAPFDAHETPEQLRLAFASDDASGSASVVARPAGDLPRGSVFGSLAAAVAFFADAPVGYSPARPDKAEGPTHLAEGIKLSASQWPLQPLEVDVVTSSVLDDRAIFPLGTAAFDSALILRQVPVSWSAQAPVACFSAAASASTRLALAPTSLPSRLLSRMSVAP